ncbi:MAG: NADH-quinone oxidoreductase subunit I [Christensenellales bacterium]
MRRCGQRLGVNASGRGRICWICWRRATRTEAKRNGIRLEDKAACCGCGLCKAACPHQAITMTPDEEGFCYPVIDAQRCTNCGACRRICAYGQGPKEKPLAITLRAIKMRTSWRAALPAAFFRRLRALCWNRAALCLARFSMKTGL